MASFFLSTNNIRSFLDAWVRVPFNCYASLLTPFRYNETSTKIISKGEDRGEGANNRFPCNFSRFVVFGGPDQFIKAIKT